MRQSEYRPELEGLDPVVLLIIPLSLLLLSVMVIRARSSSQPRCEV